MSKRKVPFYDQPDAKVIMPFSYRVLRIVGWVVMALGMIPLVKSTLPIGQPFGFIAPELSHAFQIFSSISMPLFVVAALGLIVSKNKTFKEELIFYGVGMLGIAIAIIIGYERYIISLVNKLLGDGREVVEHMLLQRFPKLLQCNVFVDLFLCALFSFFVEYEPKTRVFKKNKVIFRCLSVIPAAYSIFSFIISIFVRTGDLQIPVDFFPFLSTKHPLIIGVFFFVIVFLKCRSEHMRTIGKSEEEITRYENSNNRALTMSRLIGLGYAVIGIIDAIVLLILSITLYDIADFFMLLTNGYRIGEASGAIFCIPFILLYSYKRKPKNPSLDLVINLIGIGLVAFIFIEGTYEMLMTI